METSGLFSLSTIAIQVLYFFENNQTISFILWFNAVHL